MSRHRQSSPRHYPRTARINELLREILAEALERIDDERLTMVAITGVDCDADLRYATVFFDSLAGPDSDAAVLGAFGEIRYLLQRAVARQTRIKRTPELKFEPDPAVRTAARLEEVLATIPEPRIHAEDLVGEQIAYYRARAPEYEQWWDRTGSYDQGPDERRRHESEIRQVQRALDAAGIHGSVLELAGGTGIWTRRLALLADRLTVVDASPEVIALNRSHLPADGCPVEFVTADLFGWEPTGRYDAVFFAFWLSHVPAARFEDFFELVDQALAPGGMYFLIDGKDPQPSSADPARADADVSHRTLADGREFDIVKTHYEPGALSERLADLGWDSRFHTTENYFLFGGGTRADDG